MKKISFALFFCLCALAGFAQNSKPLDLKEIVSGEFIPQNISGVIPIPGDGEHYSQMNADKTQIIIQEVRQLQLCSGRQQIAYCNRNSACIPPLLYSSTLYI